LLSKYFIKVLTNGFIKIDDEKVYLNHYPANDKKKYFNLVGHIHHKWD
jgi:calcineurin-like phosphoesterase family protein